MPKTSVKGKVCDGCGKVIKDKNLIHTTDECDQICLKCCEEFIQNEREMDCD